MKKLFIAFISGLLLIGFCALNSNTETFPIFRKVMMLID